MAITIRASCRPNGFLVFASRFTTRSPAPIPRRPWRRHEDGLHARRSTIRRRIGRDAREATQRAPAISRDPETRSYWRRSLTALYGHDGGRTMSTLTRRKPREDRRVWVMPEWME